MKNPLLENKGFLFTTEFLVGIGLMGVEIGASRLIAPYLSSSQVIWTIIIGMIMIAMALGNFIGGKLADKYPNPRYLYYCLLMSGTYIVLIPFVGRFIIVGITGVFALFVNSGLIIWSSIFVCLILFIPPLMLLGFVTPTLIKYSIKNHNTSGKTVGILEALNTLGSILGTFLPTFITIPTIGTSMSFALFGGLIAVVALIFIITDITIRIRMNRKPSVDNEEDNEILEEPKAKAPLKIKHILTLSLCSVFLIIGIALNIWSNKFVFWNDSEIIYEGESMYNYLQVRENKSDASYEFSTSVLFSVQSKVKKDGSLTGSYYDYCLAAPYMLDNLEGRDSVDVLILGNGTGSFASLLKYDGTDNDVNHFPYNTNITGVEIDQKIIDIGEKYFCPKSLGVNTICDDGRSFINRDDNKYDVIMVDAYTSISAPFQMTTVEFFKTVKEHLRDDGVVVMNINMATGEKGSVEYALCDTVSTQFKNVFKYDVTDGTGMEVFVSNNDDAMTNLGENLKNVNEYSLRMALNRVLNYSISHEYTGEILYDDNADVELRSMGAINTIINNELEFYRNYYKENGLIELIKYLL